jgi:hypothetical protein
LLPATANDHGQKETTERRSFAPVANRTGPREQKVVDKTAWLATARRQRRRQLAAAGDASDDDGRRLERERLADNAVGAATTLGEPAAGEGGGDQPDNRDGG